MVVTVGSFSCWSRHFGAYEVAPLDHAHELGEGHIAGQVLEAAVGGTWVTTYELPEDGQYSFTVEILAAGGESIQLASFSVDLGSSLNPWVLAGAVGLVVSVSAVLLIKKRQEV